MNGPFHTLLVALAFAAVVQGQSSKEPGCPPDCTNPNLSATQITSFARSLRGSNPQKMAWLYRKAAEMGDKEAQFELGDSYLNGSGVQQDFAEAAKWLVQSGSALAAFRLGELYHVGRGVPKSEAEAQKWYCTWLNSPGSPPDEQHAFALTWLAAAYARGESQAPVTYSTTDSKGNVTGTYLGRPEDLGRPVPRDLVYAYAFNNLASARGLAAAASIRDGLVANMTAAQLEQAQALSVRLSTCAIAEYSRVSGGDTGESPIDRIRKAPHVAMPKARESGPVGSGAGIVSISNRTGDRIRVYYGGPTNHSLELAPGEVGQIRVTTGSYRVAAEVPNSSVMPFYGEQMYRSDANYSSEFYIDTTVR